MYVNALARTIQTRSFTIATYSSISKLRQCIAVVSLKCCSVPCSAIEERALPCSQAIPSSAVQHHIMLGNAVYIKCRKTVQCTASPCNCAVLCSTVQYSVVLLCLALYGHKQASGVTL